MISEASVTYYKREADQVRTVRQPPTESAPVLPSGGLRNVFCSAFSGEVSEEVPHYKRSVLYGDPLKRMIMVV